MTNKNISSFGDNSASATLKNLRCSPQKVNLVLQLIRGLSAQDGLDALKFCEKRIALDIRKALYAAVSNAENNKGLDVDRLRIVEASVGKGMTIRRFQARAKGRPSKIRKVFSRVHIVVSQQKEAA